MALNNITIMGRLCGDPELRRTNSGTPVTSFTIACDRDFGEKETDFVECVAWRNTAEFVNNYFRKGSMAIVSGRLQIRSWTDKDGNKRKTAEVIAEHVYFGESKSNSGNQNSGTVGFAKAQTVPGAFAPIEDDDSTLPF